MVNEPTSLRQMNQQVQQWYSEKPAFDNNGLNFQKGDLIFFNFVANGDEGDRFIKIYQAHIIPAVSKNNKQYNETRYCVSRNDGEPCEFCDAGLTDIKERMSMWFYVRNWLHATQPKEKQFPAVPHEGGIYFNEEVNDFRNWETSAWRESPWSDICRLAEIYHGLHNFTARIDTVGENLTRRFKLTAMPNSDTFPNELYERAKNELTPIPELLKGKLVQAVQVRPVGTQPAPTPAFGQPANNVSTPPFATSSTGFAFGSNNANPSSPLGGLTGSTPTQQEPSSDVGNYTPPEGEEQKRPMRSLF